MADDGPPLLRPIPRRPFDMDRGTVTPPYDDQQPDLDRSSENDADSINRFLSPSTPAGSASISRPESLMNLTSPTLLGIYSSTSSSRDRNFEEGDGTPWGAGTQTPIRRPSLDDATYDLMRRRQRGNTLGAGDGKTSTHRTAPAVSTVSLVIRMGVLFGLGVGFGVLLARFQDADQWPGKAWSTAESAMQADQYYTWAGFLFWGVAGVMLGGAMPLFDRMWAESFDSEAEGKGEEAVKAEAVMGIRTADLAMILRPVGAFVGIIFAIRKLAWDSTLQLSFTLASVNPLLWWLIDRSKVGFILSAAVGLVGSVILMGVDPDMMPVPSANLSMLRGGSFGVGGSLNDSVGSPTATAASTSPSASASSSPFPLASIASRETVETGVWMLSVLFCSSLCFGNIGRRLAWDKSADTRSRWGGVR